ncbi:Hpt domain-containing protein [Asticcacaulis solisilvae]|uniref:Hpt domain-containing protein n=1 Tax=Asticcacaulis solisilvae TaxID=1217274 RepID=UPI003FD85F67
MPAATDHLPPDLLDRLQRTYRGHLAETRAQIAPAIARAAARTADSDDYATLRHHAHKLGGSGASYGFARLSETGKALDSLLRTQTGVTDAIGRAAAELLSAIDEALG